MTDLGNRFADGGGAAPSPAPRPDGIDRLRQPSPPPRAAGRWIGLVRGRADLVAAVCALAVAGLAVWPHVHPAAIRLPPIADTGDNIATIKVHPLWDNGVAAPPDWYGLFNAYQLETSLRDISIRCNFALPTDARVDLYLHARLETGTEIRIFLADPGTCPKS